MRRKRGLRTYRVCTIFQCNPAAARCCVAANLLCDASLIPSMLVHDGILFDRNQTHSPNWNGWV
jgi:hypothetical protein